MDEYDKGDEQTDPDPGTLAAALLGGWRRLSVTAVSGSVAADGASPAWTEAETVALVEVWAADDVQHSLKTCVHNSHIFAEIAEKMSGSGFPKTAEQCQSRMKRLKKTYRRCCHSRR